jgi:hypothetical protein
MMKQESKRQVTIEDLLRLKRTERPQAEFWTEFERELRAKQLAALVEKRPWWRSVSLSNALRGLTRYSVPFGATAALALTFFGLRHSQPSPAISSHLAMSVSTDADQPANEPASGSAMTATAQPEQPIAAVVAPAATRSFTSEANAPGELARMVPMLSGDETAANAEEARPSARSIADNLAAAEVMLGAPQPGFEARALPMRSAPREPLADMANPAESRRSRFAAAFASMTSEASPAPSARVARRLSDEQLYDSIHRFGASGNTVSIRF